MYNKTITTHFGSYKLSPEAQESLVEQLNTGEIPVIAGDSACLDENATNQLNNMVGFVIPGSAKKTGEQIEYEVSFIEKLPMCNVIKALLDEGNDQNYSLAIMGTLSEGEPPILNYDAKLKRVNCYYTK